MNSFKIAGNNGFIEIELIETYTGEAARSPKDGFDCTCQLRIENDGFSVSDTLYASTGQFEDLLEKLSKIHAELDGICQYRNEYEDNLNITFSMKTGGHLEISGKYWKLTLHKIQLEFSILSDQSYLTDGLTQLRRFCSQFP